MDNINNLILLAIAMGLMLLDLLIIKHKINKIIAHMDESFLKMADIMNHNFEVIAEHIKEDEKDIKETVDEQSK